MKNIDVSIGRMLDEFKYPTQWIEFDLLSLDFLKIQWLNARNDREWNDSPARKVYPDAGTEHWRFGAFSKALRDPRVLSGEKLHQLLELILLDPDPGMAQSPACRVVASDSPLPSHLVLAAAQHPAMSVSADSYEEAMARLAEAGFQNHLRIALNTIARASPWVQLEVLRRRRAAADEAVQRWLSVHGANRRVRVFAKHGLHLRRSVPVAARTP